MKVRVQEENINTKKYFEEYYRNPKWREGGDGMDTRIAQSLELIEKPSKRVLDVGCSDGTFGKLYLKKFPQAEMWGIDIAQSACDIAMGNCPQGKYLASSCYELPFVDDFFDLVYCAEMLEHVEFPEEAIAEMYRVLMPKGTLIITTPNETADDYIEHLWKWDTEGVRLMIESRMNKNIVTESGLKIVEEHPSFHNGHIMYLKAIKQ